MKFNMLNASEKGGSISLNKRGLLEEHENCFSKQYKFICSAVRGLKPVKRRDSRLEILFLGLTKYQILLFLFNFHSNCYAYDIICFGKNY